MSDSGRTIGDRDETSLGAWVVEKSRDDDWSGWLISTENGKVLVAGMIGREADARLMAAAKQTLAQLQRAEAENQELRRLLATAIPSLSIPPYPAPNAAEAFEALREASGGCWDGVDAEAYVREIRGDDEAQREIERLTVKLQAAEDIVRAWREGHD